MASCSPSLAEAGAPAAQRIEIPAGRLPEAIAELSRDTGISIGAEGILPASPTPAISGRLSPAQALSRLLAGTGLVARQVGPRAWRIERRRAASPPARSPDSLAAAGPDIAPAAVASEDIVVTAVKRPVALDALPMAATVLRFDALRAASPASGTALVAAESEGLAMTALGPGRNRLFLRGISDSPFNGESQSTVAVVLDDARLTYAAPDPDIRLVDIERVEVLKGPQGSLYGTGALGGIYHIVTRRADLDAVALSASAGGEAVKQGNLGWNGTSVVNLPVVRGTAGLRLVGYAAREAGWIDTGARRDSNQSRLLGARANLGLALGGGWRADLSGLLQLLESRDSRYVYAPGARARPAQLPEPHDNDMYHLATRITGQTGGLDLVLSTGITWHEVGDKLDATIGAAGFGLAHPALLQDRRQYRVWDSEARMAGHLGGLRWLLGLSHVEARQDALWTLHARAGASATIDDDRRRARDTAVFGDVTIPVASGVRIDAGARLFQSTITERRRLATGETVSRRRRRTGMTPSLAASWQAGARQIVYLRYASADRQGGSDIGPAGELQSLKSDELRTLEAGWRRDLGHGGHLDLGLYASRWENVQSDMLQANGLIESENAGNARIYGAEATLDLPIAGSMRLEGGANVTNARLTRNMLGARLDDRRLPVVPRFTARAALSRTFALGSADASLRLSLRYVGQQHLSFDPAVDRPMGSYFDTRIEAQARLRRLRLSIVADNLLGGEKDGFAFGNPLRFATTSQYTPQKPPSLSASLAIDF